MKLLFLHRRRSSFFMFVVLRQHIRQIYDKGFTARTNVVPALRQMVRQKQHASQQEKTRNVNAHKGFTARYIKLNTGENNKRKGTSRKSRPCAPWTNSKSEDALIYCVCGFEFCQNHYESTTMVRQISRISPESKFSNLRFRYIP